MQFSPSYNQLQKENLELKDIIFQSKKRLFQLINLIRTDCGELSCTINEQNQLNELINEIERLYLYCKSHLQKKESNKDEETHINKEDKHSYSIKELSGLDEEQNKQIIKMNLKGPQLHEQMLQRRKKSLTYYERMYKKDILLKRCIFVGDDDSDKTNIIRSFIQQQFPSKPHILLEDIQCIDIHSRYGIVKITITDAFSSKEHEYLRKIIYSSGNIFVICFSLIHPQTFSNIVQYWIPEIKKYRPELPLILCGSHYGEQHEVIPFELIESTIKSNFIDKYIECNSTTGKGISGLFTLIGDLLADNQVTSGCIVC
ncbi:hypothetical protein, conserved [Entamoeba dispar SAW760]|uniref:small monomeric GTPase n=1 Tax=Entamoeba dispar (strain ATCC PRA-260 / SAW760) TaxID=370354 RepID=B0EE15_ENTDS|nr:uncharacterized protein EDI_142580 [Entamoeba dispar SAW760]EDR27226.1 hypothetical protein, conserved [Entamoeba dispar SAW760]|eukprot:EDR27226.1 hypothetical protein, conserved [Entamoeba dispar SAW760]